MTDMFETLSRRRPAIGLRHQSARKKREVRQGLGFTSPWIIGLLLFWIFPVVATFLLSFADFHLSQDAGAEFQFIGLDNYRLLLRDRQAWRSMWITIRFGLIALPVGMLFPLGLALLLNSRFLSGKRTFRTLFYLPYVIPFVAAVFVWGGVLNPESGWMNEGLRAIGVDDPPRWTNDVNWVYPAYVLMGIWGVGSAMLITLAGLQGVPTDLYDAAKVDGAGPWRSFRNVTFPMISPVVFYNLVLGIVGLFQYFLVPLVVNQGTGQPGGATMFYNLYLYKTFFTFQNMSYGATLAWVLFIIVLIVTIVLFATAKYWVFYAGEKR